MVGFLDSWGYASIVIIIVILGFIFDLTRHLTKQMKKSGKWKMDYDKLAINMVAGIIIMSFLTRVFRGDFGASTFIIVWLLLLPGYLLLRNLKKV